MRARILGLVVTVAVAAGLLTACELPLVFVVNSTADSVDANPGNGVCETATEDECTLRAAIQEATALGSAVAIELSAGETYDLTLGGAGEDAGATGDLDTAGNIQLRGHGSVIDANQIDRVIDHHSGVLLITEVELRWGSMAEGAGIRNAADLHFIDSSISSAVAIGLQGPPSGGIYHTAGTLNVVRSSIGSFLGFTEDSGGIVQLAGTVNIVDSLISSSLSTSQGYELSQIGGTAVIVNSRLIGGSTVITFPVCDETGCVDWPAYFVSAPMKIDGDATVLRSTLKDPNTGTVIYGDGVVGASGSLLFGHCEADVTSLGYNALRNNVPRPCTDSPHATDLLLDAYPREWLQVPVVGEPVIDAIPVGTPVLCSVPNDHDQRQLPRPAGVGCDIGAIERQPDDPTG